MTRHRLVNSHGGLERRCWQGVSKLGLSITASLERKPTARKTLNVRYLYDSFRKLHTSGSVELPTYFQAAKDTVHKSQWKLEDLKERTGTWDLRS
jgi:hypothetical protein